MFVTRVTFTNSGEKFANFEEANGFKDKVVPWEYIEEIVFFKSDAMLDGILHPVDFGSYDPDTNVLQYEFYHETMDHLRQFRQRLTENKVWEKSGELLLELGWEMDFHVDTTEAFPENAVVVNLKQNITFVRPERRAELMAG